MSEKSSALLWLELIWKLQLEKVQPWNDSSLACWLPGSAESRADTAHINFARFHAEPAKPLCKQWVIIHQQNVRRHFVSWKAQYSGLPSSGRVTCTSPCQLQSAVVLGTKPRHVLEVIVFEVKVESLAGRWDALFATAGCCTFGSYGHIGTKTRSNSYAWIPNVHRFLNTKCLCIFAGNYFFNKWLTTCSQ